MSKNHLDRIYKIDKIIYLLPFLKERQKTSFTKLMKLSEDKKRELVNKLFWDRNMDIEYILKLLDGGPERFPGDKANLYCRLLTTYGWYTLLKLIPFDLLKDEALSETVIMRLFPNELRKKYQYAKKVLSE